MIDIKPNRKMRRLHLQSAPHRNTSNFQGVPIQIVNFENGTHKVLRHRPKKSDGIFKPKNK